MIIITKNNNKHLITESLFKVLPKNTYDKAYNLFENFITMSDTVNPLLKQLIDKYTLNSTQSDLLKQSAQNIIKKNGINYKSKEEFIDLLDEEYFKLSKKRLLPEKRNKNNNEKIEYTWQYFLNNLKEKIIKENILSKNDIEDCVYYDEKDKIINVMILEKDIQRFKDLLNKEYKEMFTFNSVRKVYKINNEENKESDIKKEESFTEEGIFKPTSKNKFNIPIKLFYGNDIKVLKKIKINLNELIDAYNKNLSIGAKRLQSTNPDLSIKNPFKKEE